MAEPDKSTEKSGETPAGNGTDKLTGYPALVALVVKFVNGLSNERMLLMCVIFGFGYVMMNTLDQQREREMTQARMHQESAEKDRRHCDDREIKLQEKLAQREKDLQNFFAQQAELQRRHDQEREDKALRLAIDRDDRLKSLLTQILAKVMELKP